MDEHSIFIKLQIGQVLRLHKPQIFGGEIEIHCLNRTVQPHNI